MTLSLFDRKKEFCHACGNLTDWTVICGGVNYKLCDECFTRISEHDFQELVLPGSQTSILELSQD
jgi:hypothetical protein